MKDLGAALEAKVKKITTDLEGLRVGVRDNTVDILTSKEHDNLLKSNQSEIVAKMEDIDSRSKTRDVRLEQFCQSNYDDIRPLQKSLKNAWRRLERIQIP